jgi:hypothetical protein
VPTPRLKASAIISSKGIKFLKEILFSGKNPSSLSASSSILFKTPMVRGFPQLGQMPPYFFVSLGEREMPQNL